MGQFFAYALAFTV
ncbi:TPA: membrane protein YoeI [Klebsiella pneumoniae]|nr:membrane protein YoeI [Klebsiella pneumoniae]